MKIKFLPQSFTGKLSVALGISIPILFFLGFYMDSEGPIHLTPIIIVAWFISGTVALIRRDWSIMTILSTIISIIVFFVFMSEPWVQQIFKDIFAPIS